MANFLLIIIAMKLFENICLVDGGKGIFYTIANIDRMPESKYNSSADLCTKLIRHQQRLCQSHNELIPSVVRGLHLAIQECQFQFTNNHWNCVGYNITVGKAIKNKRKKNTVLDNLVNKGTPESGYLISIMSAGVAHQVTLACSRGQHRYCGCDKTIYDAPLETNFQWSGCSDNIHFGAAFSKQFLDTPHKKRLKKNPTLGLLNLHNSHSGRKIVMDNMGIKCKCHGVSGSCETKTCYRALPAIRNVAQLLKRKFFDSVLVELQKSKLVPKYRVTKGVLEDELAYVHRSPNFCERNPKFGSLGTSGRLCNNTIHEDGSENEASCRRLCCNRGYKATEYMKQENCRCKFIWCCKVVCDSCVVKAVETVCN